MKKFSEPWTLLKAFDVCCRAPRVIFFAKKDGAAMISGKIVLAWR